LDNFVVGVTNRNPATTTPVYKSSYTVCGQYSGRVPASTNATVFCALSNVKFRYVIIQGSWTIVESLCIKEVYVYAKRK